MEKVEYFTIVKTVAKFYCNGSGGSFFVYRCKGGDKKFLVCWGYPTEGYSRYWTNSGKDACEYAQELAR